MVDRVQEMNSAQRIPTFWPKYRGEKVHAQIHRVKGKWLSTSADYDDMNYRKPAYSAEVWVLYPLLLHYVQDKDVM